VIPLTDNPVTRLSQDAFGFEPHVRQLDEAVRNAQPLPLTVGVFGGWGTGKSSFLGMWRDLLEVDDPAAHTIWFNPWKYDQKVEVWSALLHTVLAEIGRVPRLRDRALQLARAATWLSLRAGLGHATSLATAGVVGKEQINSLLDGLSKDDADQYDQVNRFEQDFAKAVDDAVGEGGRLVVFIDDLDRCTPDSAITVLESLKLFLGNARCVFVLALDVDVLAAVSTNKFRGALVGAPEESVSGMRYLEKIVQLPFFLPDVGFPALQGLLAPSLGVLAKRKQFWELLQVGLGNNPRRLKRFVNVLNLALPRQWLEAPIDPRPLQLAKLLILRSEHREFFRQITR
jgi:KAP family P-loop domain